MPSDWVNIKGYLEENSKHGIICTEDFQQTEDDNETVQQAIQEVISSRREYAKILDKTLELKDTLEPIEQLLNNLNLEDLAPDDLKICQDMLSKSFGFDNIKPIKALHDQLKKNFELLENSKKYMERNYIRIPIVGGVHCGKTTFMRSALGQGELAKKLFPVANGPSCTGTRTVLIYDQDNQNNDLKIKIYFYKKEQFLDNFIRVIDNIISTEIFRNNIEVTNALKYLKQEASSEKTFELPALLTDLLTDFKMDILFQNHIYQEIPNAKTKEIMESFIDYILFANNVHLKINPRQETPNEVITMEVLQNSWAYDNTTFEINNVSEFNMDNMEKYICKHSPDGNYRYNAYCCIEHIEIRGNICNKIAGLELIDSIGDDDKAIDREEQIKKLLENSDGMIFLFRPASQTPNFDDSPYEKLIKEDKGIDSNCFLTLVFNHDKSNDLTTDDGSTISPLFFALKHYNNYNNFSKVYLTDVNNTQEVQNGVLVGLLKNVKDNMEKINKQTKDKSDKAIEAIHQDFRTIYQWLQKFKNDLDNKEDPAKYIQQAKETILRIVEKISELKNNILKGENKLLFTKVKDISNNLVECILPNEKDIKEEYYILQNETKGLGGGIRAANQYIVYLKAHAKMLQRADQAYDELINEMQKYITEKKKDLLLVLLKDDGGKLGRIVNYQSHDSYIQLSQKISNTLNELQCYAIVKIIQDLESKENDPTHVILKNITPIIDRFDHNQFGHKEFAEIFTNNDDNQELITSYLDDKDKIFENESKIIHNQLRREANKLSGDLKEKLLGETESGLRDSTYDFDGNVQETVIRSIFDKMVEVLSKPDVNDDFKNLYFNQYEAFFCSYSTEVQEKYEIMQKSTDELLELLNKYSQIKQ